MKKSTFENLFQPLKLVDKSLTAKKKVIRLKSGIGFYFIQNLGIFHYIILSAITNNFDFFERIQN